MATIFSIVALVAAIATAWFVWIQANLLGTQNELSAVIQLNAVWNSEYMRALRSRWAEDEIRDRLGDSDRDLISLEPLLEFLEEFAGLHKRKILGDELIWDSTIGWHAVRYYLYNQENGNIPRLKNQWADATLYQNLSRLWDSYLKPEAKQRGIDENELVKQVRETKQKFLDAERHAAGLSQSAD